MKTAILILAATILLLNCSSDEPEIQDPSLIALQKIYDNSGGKGDATAITMEDMKAIGLKNLEDTRLKQYQNAISTKKDFSNPATVGELQTMVEDINNENKNNEPETQDPNLFLGTWSLIKYEEKNYSRNFSCGAIVWKFNEDKNVTINYLHLLGFNIKPRGSYTYSIKSKQIEIDGTFYSYESKEENVLIVSNKSAENNFTVTLAKDNACLDANQKIVNEQIIGEWIMTKITYMLGDVDVRNANIIYTFMPDGALEVINTNKESGLQSGIYDYKLEYVDHFGEGYEDLTLKLENSPQNGIYFPSSNSMSIHFELLIADYPNYYFVKKNIYSN